MPDPIATSPDDLLEPLSESEIAAVAKQADWYAERRNEFMSVQIETMRRMVAMIRRTIGTKLEANQSNQHEHETTYSR